MGSGHPRRRRKAARPLSLVLALVLLGSTAVMLFATDTLRINPAWAPARPLSMGEMMANPAERCGLTPGGSSDNSGRT